jgi:hypothetical protein
VKAGLALLATPEKLVSELAGTLRNSLRSVSASLHNSSLLSRRAFKGEKSQKLKLLLAISA